MSKIAMKSNGRDGKCVCKGWAMNFKSNLGAKELHSQHFEVLKFRGGGGGGRNITMRRTLHATFV